MTQSGLKILIVEDDKLIATVLKIHIANLEHEVVDIVTTGEEAVDVCKTIKPDVVVMDINLAGKLNGIEAAAQIQAAIETQIVYISGDDAELLFNTFDQLTPDNYLCKPILKDPLARNISKVLKKAI